MVARGRCMTSDNHAPRGSPLIGVSAGRTGVRDLVADSVGQEISQGTDVF